MSENILLEIRGVTKRFPGTVALNNVSLQVTKAEVHALCGENGAGKSTLMNIVGGVLPCTEGEVFFEGVKTAFRSPKDAQDMGIGFVHQELSLCPHLSAAENIFIGRLPEKHGMIDRKKLYQNANEILLRFGAKFDSKKRVSDLNVSEQQLVEITKSVSLNCKLLILDEPTSSLTDAETAKLFEVIKELKARGISIVYISHRMPEIFEICDRVTVLKDGAYVATMQTDSIDADDIIRAMVGRNIDNLYPPKSNCVQENDEILKIENLCSNGVYENISFSLKKGEILGFAGLVGAGRSEIMRGLCSVDVTHGGTITMNGEKTKFKSYKDAVKAGICYLTEDRKNSGLFLSMKIKENIASANLEMVSNGILLSRKKEEALAERYRKSLNIRMADVNDPISSLSGGNQQKCLLGKWLSIVPKVIIMDEPTRGIDVGAKSEIHSLLRDLALSGVGVIVVSSELPEVMGISDRVAIIHEGKLAGFLVGDKITEENIMQLASGRSTG